MAQKLCELEHGPQGALTCSHDFLSSEIQEMLLKEGLCSACGIKLSDLDKCIEEVFGRSK